MDGDQLTALQSLLYGWTIVTLEPSEPGRMFVRAVRGDQTREVTYEHRDGGIRIRRVRVPDKDNTRLRCPNIQELYREVVEYLGEARGREVCWERPTSANVGVTIRARDPRTGGVWEAAYQPRGNPRVSELIEAMEIAAPRGESWGEMVKRTTWKGPKAGRTDGGVGG